jgi:hypothetical protein
MFGLEDLFFVLKNGYGDPDRYDKSKIIKETSISREKPVIGFLPSFVFDDGSLRFRFIPKESSGVIYRIPKDTICPNPYEIRKTLDMIYQDATNNARDIASDNLGVVGVSLGCTLATRLANSIPSTSLRLVVPGASLPYCIKTGLATKPIFAKAEINGFTFEGFEKELSVFSPENNIDHLPENIEITLGGWDVMIPFRNGLDLVNSLKKKCKNPNVKVRTQYGHGFTIKRYKSHS